MKNIAREQLAVFPGLRYTMAIIWILFLQAIPVFGLIGYDCTGKGLNITTLSLINVGECNVDLVEPTKTETYIQLMQLSDYDHAYVTQCKIEVDRTVYYCGMHSHISIVQQGRKEYIRELGAAACYRLHETGTFAIGAAVIDKIEINATNHRTVTLAGAVTTDGRCSGAQYTDGYGSWDNVVVQATVKVTLFTREATIKRAAAEIIFPSGARCPVQKGHCLDTDGTESYWTPVAADSCHFDRYDILFEGIATRLTAKEMHTSPTIYTVTTQDTTFALTKTAEFNLCGYKLFRTEHPKLLILETQKERIFKSRSKTSVDNLDIFAYVNSKFVYVEKHIRTQLTQLYRDIMEQKCALEHQILLNALSLASIAPDEMATRIMKAPGYTAVVTGEVIHLIKCLAVTCRVRHMDECYNELPVMHKNESLFMLPRSRILTKTGTPRDCNELLPAMYEIEESWFRMGQRPVETLPPPVIQPLTQPKWKYVSPSSLATSGIYSSEDLDRLRNHIMFPVEKPSMLNTLARGAMGQSVPPGSISLIHLLDEQSLDRIADSAGRKVWRGFMDFGSASAGILGIILILRLAKLVIDTIIHGYALHSMYGWSLHLLGAIWTSITNLLLHLGRSPNNQQNKAASDEDTSQEKSTAIQPSQIKGTTDESVTPNRNIFVETTDTERLRGQTYTYADLRERININ